MSAAAGKPGRMQRWQILVLLAILLSNLIPTAVIGFGFVIPGSCIDGWNPLTQGFVASILGLIPTYVFGVLAAWRFGRQAAAR